MRPNPMLMEKHRHGILLTTPLMPSRTEAGALWSTTLPHNRAGGFWREKTSCAPRRRHNQHHHDVGEVGYTYSSAFLSPRRMTGGHHKHIPRLPTNTKIHCLLRLLMSKPIAIGWRPKESVGKDDGFVVARVSKRTFLCRSSMKEQLLLKFN